jgi:hypothetical protein
MSPRGMCLHMLRFDMGAYRQLFLALKTFHFCPTEILSWTTQIKAQSSAQSGLSRVVELSMHFFTSCANELAYVSRAWQIGSVFVFQNRARHCLKRRFLIAMPKCHDLSV